MEGKDSGKILIVDDSELNRAILAELFYQEYEIQEAENGREALEKIQEQGEEITAILLDIVMPEMDGFSVLRFLNERRLMERIPVFLITAETSVDTALRGYENGVVDIINKPIINPVIVRKRVNNAVELFRNKNHLQNLVDRQVETIRRQTEKLNGINISMIDILSSVIEFRSNESGQHVRHIRMVTRKILQKLRQEYEEYPFTDEEIEMISNASAMHDVGKISIPDYILNKPGKLTAEEFDEMKKHTIYGCEIIASIPFFREEDTFRYGYEICRHHHERYDGRGYPDGLKGEEIPVAAQVVSIADVYDALVSDRVYKKACTHQEAIAMIQNGECGNFNPKILECFLNMADELDRELYGKEDKQESGFLHRLTVPVAAKAPVQTCLSDYALEMFERERQKTQWFNEMSGEILFDYNKIIDEIEFTEKFHEVFGECTHIHHARDYIERCNFADRTDMERIQREVAFLTPQNPLYKTRLSLDTLKHQGELCELYLRVIWGSSPHDEYACAGYIGKIVSVRKFQKETQQWRQRALHDYLTGAMNRHALWNQMELLLKGDIQDEFAILFMDLDGFKNINDTMGHLTGDRVLKQIARILQDNVRASDIVARVGGDEFIVVLEGMKGEEAIANKAEWIRTLICENRNSEQVSCSIGIARYPADGKDLQVLLEKADKALYAAKNRGKNCYEFYSPELEEIECSSSWLEKGK